MSGRQARRDAVPATEAGVVEARLATVPPHNLEAEKALLGGLLLSMGHADKLFIEIRVEDFYSPVHQIIFRAMAGLWRKGQPIDAITLSDALRTDGMYQTAGGPAYLAELLDATISAATWRAYAQIVREAARRRYMIQIGARLVEIACDQGRDPGEFAGIAQHAVDLVLGDRAAVGQESPAEFLGDYFAYLERLSSDQGVAVPTPFYKLNSMLVGFFPGEVTILGARPGCGKTAMALNFAEHAAGLGHCVGIFSLEMVKFLLVNRLFSARAEVRAQRFRDGKFADDDWKRMYGYADFFKGLPIRIYDQPGLRASDLRATCRRWKREHGLRLAIIDYLQLVPADARHSNREQALAEVSRTIKGLANDLDISILLLSQLNRDVEKRPDKRPLLSDLRESGAAEQDADNVLFIKPWSGTHDVVETLLILAKGRNNSVGDVPLLFRRNYVQFVNPEA